MKSLYDIIKVDFTFLLYSYKLKTILLNLLYKSIN